MSSMEIMVVFNLIRTYI